MSSSRRVNEFSATIQRNPAPDVPATWTLADPDGPLLTIRSLAGQDAGPDDLVLPANVQLSANPTLHAFFDNSVMELFVDGALCFTTRFYHRNKQQPVATLCLPGSYTVTSGGTYSLQTIWPV